MLKQKNNPRSPVEPSDRVDNTRPTPGSDTDIDIDTDGRVGGNVPATVEINLDLGIDPVAYRYESWSEMADGWVDSLRSTAETMPDPDRDPIRNVTPLVPLSEVEALVERMVLSGEVAMAPDRTDATEDTVPP